MSEEDLFATAHVQELLDQALRAFAGRSPVLVALDFDGALAPIVLDPDAARMLPASAVAVERLAGLDGVTVALVSGREAADLTALAAPPAGTVVVGSHGAQWGTARLDGDTVVLDGAEVALTPAQAELHARLVAQSERLVDGVPGAWVQTKPTTVVVHTRGAARDDAERLTEAALTGPGALPGVRAMRGKEVVEMAVVEVTKGDAVRRLREQTGAAAVLYAGDDRTDEDAFAVLGDDDVSIKVGDGDTRAAYRVASPEALAAVLGRVADLLADAAR